jgi:Tfp pilus assembly protein PilP
MSNEEPVDELAPETELSPERLEELRAEAMELEGQMARGGITQAAHERAGAIMAKVSNHGAAF